MHWNTNILLWPLLLLVMAGKVDTTRRYQHGWAIIGRGPIPLVGISYTIITINRLSTAYIVQQYQIWGLLPHTTDCIYHTWKLSELLQWIVTACCWHRSLVVSVCDVWYVALYADITLALHEVQKSQDIYYIRYRYYNLYYYYYWSHYVYIHLYF